MGFLFNIKPSSILYLLIIVLSTSLTFALGDGNRNLLLIGLMGIMPIVIIRYLEFDFHDIILIVLMFSLIAFPLLFNPETMRWSTVMYSCMFCLTFMSYKRLLRHSLFHLPEYITLLKWLIYAYTIVLIVQQIGVLLGLPILNLSSYDPKEPWKLNSLMSEPSHSARIVGLLMYCYISMKTINKEQIDILKNYIKQDRWVWIGFIWSMVTMGSGTAFLFIFLVFLKVLRLKTILPFLVLISIGIVITSSLEFKAINRTYKMTIATLTLDKEAIMKADGSAAARIVPVIELAKNASLFTIKGWTGHGIDQSSEDKLIDFSKIGYGKKGVSGSLFSVWYEYGFISFILFVIFSSIVCIRKKDLLTIIFWLLLVFIYTINSQIVWLCIILMYTNKYMINKVIKDENTPLHSWQGQSR